MNFYSYSLIYINTNNFFIEFYQRKQISRKQHWIYQDQTNSLGVIRLEVLGLNVLVLKSCAPKNNISVFRRESFRTLTVENPARRNWNRRTDHQMETQQVGKYFRLVLGAAHPMTIQSIGQLIDKLESNMNNIFISFMT